MAKCVVCTALNMGVEATKHPNHNTVTMTRILERRWNDVPKRQNNRYCALHSDRGTAAATGQFASIARQIAKERALNEMQSVNLAGGL